MSYFNPFLLFAKPDSGGAVNQTPQNLITYSEQFNNGSWTKIGGATISANQLEAPDGLVVADILTAGTSSYGGIVRKSFTFSAIQYTQSVYLKKHNHDYIGLRLGPSSDVYGFINLSTLAITQNVNGAVIQVEDVGNGWVRVYNTHTPTAGANQFDIAIVNSSGAAHVAHAGTEKVYIWGAQLSTGGKRIYSKTEATIIS